MDDWSSTIFFRLRKDVWQKYFEFTTDASKIPSDQTDFPVYFDMSILGDSHDFWTDYDATTDNDLIITNDDGGVRYPVEIVDIDESGTPNTGEIYFKVPTLDGDANQTFRVYYDNPDVSAQPATDSTYGSENVWTNNYVAVWHMDETSGATLDDSLENYDATDYGTLPNAVTGQMRTAQDLDDANSDYAERAYSANLNPSSFTLSMWARAEGSQGSYRSPFTSRDGSPLRGYILYAGSNNIWQFWSGTGITWHTSSGNAVVLDEWMFINATYDGTNKNFYNNSSLVSGPTASTISANTARPIRIGAGATETTPNYYFDGSIDEVRISNTDRDANWITTEYNNQNSASTFFTIP